MFSFSSGNTSVNGVLCLPYEIGNRRKHCADSVDNGNYWGSVDGVANYFVKYTENAAAAQTLKEKFDAFANKDRILNTVL